MRGHPVIRGHFLRTVSYLPHVKEPVMKGHLSCRDTFSPIYRCPLKTGFTVYIRIVGCVLNSRHQEHWISPENKELFMLFGPVNYCLDQNTFISCYLREQLCPVIHSSWNLLHYMHLANIDFFTYFWVFWLYIYIYRHMIKSFIHILCLFVHHCLYRVHVNMFVELLLFAFQGLLYICLCVLLYVLTTVLKPSLQGAFPQEDTIWSGVLSDQVFYIQGALRREDTIWSVVLYSRGTPMRGHNLITYSIFKGHSDERTQSDQVFYIQGALRREDTIWSVVLSSRGTPTRGHNLIRCSIFKGHSDERTQSDQVFYIQGALRQEDTIWSGVLSSQC